MKPDGPAVAVRCDSDGEAGAFRVARCLALAEELHARGVAVTFVRNQHVQPWVEDQVAARGLGAAAVTDAAEAHAELFDRLAVDAVVFDSPRLSPDVCAAARGTGRPAAALVDDVASEAGVDLLVDPNVDARQTHPPRGSAVLAGPGYCLMRNDVLANRPVSPPEHDAVEVPSVTAVFGEVGTAREISAVATALVATGRALHATFVASRPEVRDALSSVTPAPRQRIEVVEPGLRLHERVARSDVVLAVAEPSAYEWLCMGAAVGLLWADDSQVSLYRHLMVRRAVVGLGALANLEQEQDAAATKVARLLSDARERSRLAETGWRLVDGLGRARVAEAVLALL